MKILKFQSRNRGSFGFKYAVVLSAIFVSQCFNLVIEVLLVSSQVQVLMGTCSSVGFNLVIEVLLVSS